MSHHTQSTPPSFQGMLSHPALPDGRAPATMTVRGSSIVVSSGNSSLTLPLKGLNLRWGGANNKLLFISHPLNPDYTCFTRERGLLEELHKNADQELATQLRQLRAHSHTGRTAVLVTLLAFALLVWGVFALRKPATAFLARLVPISAEQKLGQVIYSGLLRDTKMIDDPDLTKRVEALVEPLVTAAADSGYTFEFHIAKDEDLNAYALPGGIVVIDSGTLLSADRPEEVLGVLAHELSHVTQRHMTQQVITVFGLYVVVDFVMGNVFGTIAALGQGATYLLQQGFSREHEQDADLHGLELLAKANIDPHGMVEFFQRVQKEYEQNSLSATIDKSLSFLSTHPATQERIDYLTERIKNSAPGPYHVMSKEDFAELKTRLREKL